ncbi:hypothetical protein [Actinomycetospora sp. TBRC 11914]|uniref:hypothetical protein n=1 Tax=Actinomycetospora sp. TBRC 11914 TaxID=2729387 RepID=UPI00145C8FD1|nr:hypothetical protein [Actinomycetospora sp. TBRC 11914]NMO88480.1 hypothetical protein [Actinomycetospora sp. TBRC 11914]
MSGTSRVVGAPARPSRRALGPVELLREALLGAATGARSTFGPTALALRARPDDPRAAGRVARWAPAVAVGALGEVVADKTPVVPPRNGIVGLAPRILLGGASGRVLATRDGRAVPTSGVVAALAAVGAALGGVRWRAAASRRCGSDLPGALAEDLAAAACAWWATRRAARP